MTFARNLLIVALIALLFVVVPGGGPALDIALTLLSVAFFTAIALLGVRLFRENRMTLEGLAQRQRIVLYGSVALAFWSFAATRRLFDAGGVGVLAWLGLLALASYGVFWVYMRAREY